MLSAEGLLSSNDDETNFNDNSAWFNQFKPAYNGRRRSSINPVVQDKKKASKVATPKSVAKKSKFATSKIVNQSVKLWDPTPIGR